MQQRSSFNGTLSFNVNRSNPLNTNVGFANALLGAITSYQEADAHPTAHGVFVNTEFYAQDNWRVKRTFTLDAGVRFYYLAPTQSDGDKVAQFEPDRFNATAAHKSVDDRQHNGGVRLHDQDPLEPGCLR